MAKCIFCKKSGKSGLNNRYKCGVTGKHLARKCDKWSNKMKNCKHSKISLFGRFADWLEEKFL
jgi:hypothetical protein